MMKKWMGAAVLSLAFLGCGGPLEEDSMDPVSQRQTVTSPDQLTRAGQEEQPVLQREADIIRQFQKPQQEDHLLYQVGAGGHCRGGR
jgi:hypothetical protein